MASLKYGRSFVLQLHLQLQKVPVKIDGVFLHEHRIFIRMHTFLQ